MIYPFRLLLIAFQFLTILPVPSPRECTSTDLGRSTAWFPLVGLVIGGLLVSADLLFGLLFPRLLTDALLVLLATLLTGALHLDGLADVCDGLAARGDKERFLAVMKDSRVGAVGVVGLVLGLLLKVVALNSLPVEQKAAGLLLFPMLARYAQVLILANAAAARNDGLGACFLTGCGAVQRSLATATVIPLCWLIGGVGGLMALIFVIPVAFGVRIYFSRRLGGISGDIVGFGSELVELATLLSIIAFLALSAKML